MKPASRRVKTRRRSSRLSRAEGVREESSVEVGAVVGGCVAMMIRCSGFLYRMRLGSLLHMVSN